MCGIVGFFGHNTSITESLLNEMNNTLFRRGPDEKGLHFTSDVGLAMRRLSILDLHSGSQPVFNETREICLVFNGEIYNFLELRESLIAKGHVFKSRSDTEVIVHLYEEYCDECVHYLRGMFAFALWDKKNERGLVARDRLGIKPLYYSINNNALIFGSEIKALLASGRIEKEIDYQALDAFFTFTYIPAPLSIYKQIKKLEPGFLLVFEKGKINKKQYWNIDFSKKNKTLDENSWLKLFKKEIEEAVACHLVSDVPLGAFLSGGIDSSLIVAMMSQKLTEPVETFTMGFESKCVPFEDERPYARMVSEKYQTNFNDFTVFPDFSRIAEDIVTAFDEPFADDSVIPSFYISKLTREKVKVALSGLGGDELFAGYHRYFGYSLSLTYKKIPHWLHKNIINPIVALIPEPKDGSDKINHIKRFSKNALLDDASRYLGFVSSLPQEERCQLYTNELTDKIDFSVTGQIITDHFYSCNADNSMDKMFYVDMKTYLPDNILALSDRLSMFHSLELRVPLVDHKLVELSASLPIHYKIRYKKYKYLLKKISQEWLPKSVINHRKQGFESPMGAWLKDELRSFAEKVLNKDHIEKQGILNYSFIRLKLDEHYSGKQKNNKLIFSLIMFQLWANKNIHGSF